MPAPHSPRRPSFSSPIRVAWLARGSAQSPGSTSPSHTRSPSAPVQISEPQLVGEKMTPPRLGVLGQGATVVRTPQDAMARAMGSNLGTPMPLLAHSTHTNMNGAIAEDFDDEDASSYEEDPPEPVSPGSDSHSILALPLASKSTPDLLPSSAAPRSRPAPTRAPPSTPANMYKTAPLPPLPPLPSVPLPPRNTSYAIVPQVPFAPVLLSPPPRALLDPSTLIINLETSTSSLRTTFATLTSRASHLADYLRALVPPPPLVAPHDANDGEEGSDEYDERDFRNTLVEPLHAPILVGTPSSDVDDGYRLEDPDTPFHSMFTAHLTSAGLLPQSAGVVHLFLDRPSSPYTHIMAYLRSPSSHPVLPRAVARPSTPERIEALLELRDEAKHLGLEELHKLCCDELRQKQGHLRGGTASTSTSAGSVTSTVFSHADGAGTGILRMGAVKHQMPKERARESAVSESAQVESARSRSPASSVGRNPRTNSNSGHVRDRSRSRGKPLSASDWL